MTFRGCSFFDLHKFQLKISFKMFERSKAERLIVFSIHFVSEMCSNENRGKIYSKFSTPLKQFENNVSSHKMLMNSYEFSFHQEKKSFYQLGQMSIRRDFPSTFVLIVPNRLNCLRT